MALSAEGSARWMVSVPKRNASAKDVSIHALKSFHAAKLSSVRRKAFRVVSGWIDPQAVYDVAHSAFSAASEPYWFRNHARNPTTDVGDRSKSQYADRSAIPVSSPSE